MLVNDFVLDDIYELLDEYLEANWKIDEVNGESTDAKIERVYAITDTLESFAFNLTADKLEVNQQFYKWYGDYEPEPAYLLEDEEDITGEFLENHPEFMAKLEALRKEYYGINN